MEYLTLKGSVRIAEHCQPAYLENAILNKLRRMAFADRETAILCRLRADRLWVFGEGPVNLDEANQVINVIHTLEAVCDDSLVLDISRVLWELNITLGSYDSAMYAKTA